MGRKGNDPPVGEDHRFDLVPGGLFAQKDVLSLAGLQYPGNRLDFLRRIGQAVELVNGYGGDLLVIEGSLCCDPDTPDLETSLFTFCFELSELLPVNMGSPKPANALRSELPAGSALRFTGTDAEGSIVMEYLRTSQGTCR